jgi:hypothetical protein
MMLRGRRGEESRWVRLPSTPARREKATVDVTAAFFRAERKFTQDQAGVGGAGSMQPSALTMHWAARSGSHLLALITT